jgi:Ca2+-binding EF-hand superfamily protein
MPPEQEIRQKLRAMLDTNYAGNVAAMFSAYDHNQDGRIDHGDLMDLLLDAGIGGMLSRSIIADQIIQRVDTDHDGCISLTELQGVMLP